MGVSANDGLKGVVGISSSSSYNEVLADKTAQGNAVSNSGNHGLKESAELSSSEEVLLDTSLCNEVLPLTLFLLHHPLRFLLYIFLIII